jgi:cytochrome P450
MPAQPKGFMIVGAIISAVVIHPMIDELAVLSTFLAIPESARGGDEAGDDVERLVFLDAVIKETVRLTPIIPMVARRRARGATIGGHALPAGAVAAASLYLVHRRRDLWPEPARFDPMRFVGKKPDPTHYFPFGGSTRRCLGMAFATFEMKIVLATILARVDLAAGSDRVRLVRPRHHARPVGRHAP